MWSQSFTLFLYSVAMSIVVFISFLSILVFGVRSFSKPLAVLFIAFSFLMV